MRTGIKEHVYALTLSALQTVDENRGKTSRFLNQEIMSRKLCNQQMDRNKRMVCPEVQPTEQEVKKCTDQGLSLHRATPQASGHT